MMLPTMASQAVTTPLSGTVPTPAPRPEPIHRSAAPPRLSQPVTGADLRGLTDAVRTARQDIPCQDTDLELWFAEAPADVEAAKSLCRTCPVRASCLAGALQRREPWGVWGGELLVQGEVVARKRPRGRPRKDAAA